MKKIHKLLLIIALFLIMMNPYQYSKVEAYINHCWSCGSTIDSSYCYKCRTCGWYICRTCGACKSTCKNSDPIRQTGTTTSNTNDNSDSDWLFGMLVIGLGIPGVAWFIDKMNEK